MDSFYWLGEITKASAVMVTECEIVSPILGTEIAAAVAQVIDNGGRPGAERSGDYLAFETDLVAAGGPEVTRVHSGRSRQDIGATFSQIFLREGLLQVLESLHTARDSLLTFAGKHAHEIVPAYTWECRPNPQHSVTGWARTKLRSRVPEPEGWRPMRASTAVRSARLRSAPPAFRSIGRAWPNCSASTRWQRILLTPPS